LAEGRPVTTAEPRSPKATFAPHVQEKFMARWDYVRDSINKPGRTLLDVRSDGEWTGENARGTKRGGRIPSAVHLEWLNYIDSKTKEFKPAAELRAMFDNIGVKPENEIIAY
jgi:thiosulfate/3-mercaptopyruvate sulfurtransferase